MKRVAVLGLGRFGRTLACALADAGVEVVAVDSSQERVDHVRDKVALAVAFDITDEAALRSQGIDKVDAAVVAVGTDLEASVLAVALLRQMGVRRVIARSAGAVQTRILGLVGAHEVIAPEDDAALRLAQRMVSPDLLKWIDLGEGAGYGEVECPRHMVGRTLADLDLRRRYQVNLVGVKRSRKVTTSGGVERLEMRTDHVVSPDLVFESGDVLLLVGESGGIVKLTRK